MQGPLGAADAQVRRPLFYLPSPRALALLVLLGCSVGLGACSSATYLSRTPIILADAAVDPFKWALTDKKSNTVDVLYATDRAPKNGGKPDAADHPDYGYGRSKSLAYGSCVVEIGKNVPWQKLIEQSTTLRRAISLPLSIKSVHEMGRFAETPSSYVREDGKLVDAPQDRAADEVASAGLRDEIARRLALTPKKEVYVLIHGYNNSFADAAFVMAEVWHFLGRQGVPIIYSWPAGIGGMRGYTYDRESGEFTNFHIKEFLKTLASTPGVEKIHLIGHSRGTDVITTALRELFIESRAAGRNPIQEYKVANLVLAAPDMDMEVVTQRATAERIPLDVGRTTVYVSSHDRALGFSDWFFRGVKRLGQLGESDINAKMRNNLANVESVDVINVTARTDFIGHAYFHTNPYVSADLILVLRDNLDAGAAHGRPLKELAPHFWELQTGYPNVGADGKPLAKPGAPAPDKPAESSSTKP